ncbi:Cytochrome P450 [Penicillium cf. viridicatum]|uniref:Cytochrome P450 n=1 Tax=Penicillium cf. viridicatum TaxID=2972119 RepID=A0A9W9M7X7_9EURO|nr:Cytochrome P450 [Penicillium cf. viridicatum]
MRGVSSLSRILSIYNNKSHDKDIQLYRKYGNIVRLAPNLLSIADPAKIKQIYGIGTEFYKSRFYNLSTIYDDEGLVPDTFILTNKLKLYHIDPVTERLLSKLHLQAGEPIEMSSVLKGYAMDTVFAVTFRRDFNYIEKGDILKIYGISETVADYITIFSLHPFRPKSYGSDLANLQQLGQIPWIHKFLLGRPFIARLMFGTGGGDKEMMQLAVSQIESAKQNSSEAMPLNQDKDPSSINDREIMTHAFGNISAGSDTTAIALRSILYHILKDRRVYNKLYDKFRVLEAPVQFTDANKLPYFAAVIQESLRLHPSVGMMLARVVPAGGADLCGFHLAEGTEVGINPWVLHRDREVFPDPDSFRPERWLLEETGDN